MPRTTTVVSCAPGGSDAVPLGTLGVVSDLELTHGPQGPQSLACDLNYDPVEQHRAVAPGRWIFAYGGTARPCWGGVLKTPQRADPWHLEADGWYSLGVDYLQIPAAGLDPRSIDQTIDAAIARGLPWNKAPGGGYIPVFGPIPSASQDMDAWLAQVLALTGYEVVIGADRSFHVVAVGSALPTATYAVQVALDPGAITTVEFANVLYADYLGDGSQAGTTYGDRLNPSTYPTGVVTAVNTLAMNELGRVERIADLTALGPLTAAQAQAALNNVLVQVAAQPLFTEQLEVPAEAITTLAGGPVDPRYLTGLVVVRLRGVQPPQSSLVNRLAPVEFRVGALTWVETTETVRIESYVESSRDLSAALAPQPTSGTLVV